jgi:hypothetical protein
MKRRSTEKLRGLVDELEFAIKDRDLTSKPVSSVSICWQLEHSLLVLNAVMDVLKSSNPEEFKKKFNLSKFYIFSIGRIPKGRGRSPKSVQPKEAATSERLGELVKVARANISTLSELELDKFFKHPIFGNLRLRDSTRFLELHTEHHLKIIRAIQKSH